jgi:IS5 family transposase
LRQVAAQIDCERFRPRLAEAYSVRRKECLENPASKRGRVVVKNDYEAEYAQVEAKAQSPKYEQTRRTHPKVERKLNEVVRHQDGRRARFRRLAKVLVQAVLLALVVNIKRLVKLGAQRVQAAAAALTVRAELGVT